MSTLVTRAAVWAILVTGVAGASTCAQPVGGIQGAGYRLDATAAFQNSRGEIAILSPEWSGGSDRLHGLTSLTLQNNLQQIDVAVAMGEGVAQEHPPEPLSAYLFDLRDDTSMPLSAGDRGAPNAAATETLAQMAAEPFDPIMVAEAALPKGPAPDIDVSAPQVLTASVAGGGMGGVRLAAFVVTPDLQRRDAGYFFAGGAFLAAAVRFRRAGRRTAKQFGPPMNADSR